MLETAKMLKRKTLEMCSKAGCGHVNSSFSIAEILTILYFGGVLRHDPQKPEWEERDRLILSKGQASPILYATLATEGYFPESWLSTFSKPGGKFAVHLQDDVPGVELSTGSLGHGLGVSCGMALGLKLKNELPLVFCILGDAECYEGSIWEAALVASHNNLNNLIVFLDRNCLGATDFTENMCALEPFEEKWLSFGWDTARINGHSFAELEIALRNIRGRKSNKPYIIICDTIKGNGIKELENSPFWHSRCPSPEHAAKILEEELA